MLYLHKHKLKKQAENFKEYKMNAYVFLSLNSVEVQDICIKTFLGSNPYSTIRVTQKHFKKAIKYWILPLGSTEM